MPKEQGGIIAAGGPPATLGGAVATQSELGAPRTFRLDLNSMKMDVDKPLMKMSVYWDEVGTAGHGLHRGRLVL